jgi:hypothetical protein
MIDNPVFRMKSLPIFSFLRRWFAFDATSARVGVGLGVILATAIPQNTWAQERASGLRQQVLQVRTDEPRLKSEENVQKNNMVTLAAVEATPSSPRLAEVLTPVPKLNEKRLSPEELRELRRQLLQQR